MFSTTWLGFSKSADSQQERKNVWYTTQQQHWLGWLKDYAGDGAYNRKGRGYSAEFAYNHIVNPQMLIYLAEAARIERAVLTAAAKAAFARRTTMSSMSSAIRRVIPWKIVEAALLANA